MTTPKGTLLKAIIIRTTPLLAAILLSAAVSYTFFFSRTELAPDGTRSIALIWTHDMTQHLAVMDQFDKVLRSGVLYSRWFPDFNLGYGSAWGNYYPPGFFYLTSLVNWLVDDWVKTLFIVTVLGFALSALSFYWLSREFYRRTPSAAGALCYVLLPYHVLEVYWRGAMPEFMSFILMPLVALFGLRSYREGTPAQIAALALSYFALVTVHFPVAYLTSILLALYLLVLAIRERSWRGLVRAGVGTAVGALLSAIYLAPAILEKELVTEAYTGIFDYDRSYITLLPDARVFEELMRQSFALHLLLLVMMIGFVYYISKRDRQDLAGWGVTRDWAFLAAISTFMSTSLSYYVSKLIPQIELILFAWRWQTLATLFVSLLLAATFAHLAELRPGRAHLALAYTALAIVIGANAWFTARKVILDSRQNPTLRMPVNYINPTYAPAGAIEPAEIPVTPFAVFQPEQAGTAEVATWEPTRREILVKAAFTANLRVRTYNFAGWNAEVDDKTAEVANDAYGAILVRVPQGAQRVAVTFGSTPPRTLGAALTGLGTVALLALLAWPTVLRLRSRRARDVSTVSASSAAGFVFSPQRLIGWSFPVGVIVLFVAVSSASLPPGQLQSPATAGVGSPPQQSPPAPDSNQTDLREALLNVQGRPDAVIARDEATLDEMVTQRVFRDQEAIARMVREGKVFVVPTGTRVRVLHSTLGKSFLRVLEGEHAEKEGWVPERWLQ